MAILVGVLVAVVVGWILLGPLILPRTAVSLAGRWTRTPDTPLATTLTFDGASWRLDGEVEHAGSGIAEVDGTRLRIGGDPACPDVTGTYTIEVRPIERYGLLPENTSESLALVAKDDGCADGSRRRALEGGRWVLRASSREGVYGICDPPNEEAAITGHWPEPSGCGL